MLQNTLRTLVGCCGDDDGHISSPNVPRGCKGCGRGGQCSNTVADGGGNAADDRVNGVTVGLATVQREIRLT